MGVSGSWWDSFREFLDNLFVTVVPVGGSSRDNGTKEVGHSMNKIAWLAAASLASAALVFPAAASAQSTTVHTYGVSIVNLSAEQPLSPGLVMTGAAGAQPVFRVGQFATAELATLAQDGNQLPLASRFRAAAGTTDLVEITAPITPRGSTAGGFQDHLTLTITAQPTDRLSLAAMLICTNDGFVGLDQVALPTTSSRFTLGAWDAGVERNTERSAHLPDPCSAVGPIALPGDPNGNENLAIATIPTRPIGPHPGVFGIGDLTDAHEWSGPLAQVTVTRID
jgi:hypothetical protein